MQVIGIIKILLIFNVWPDLLSINTEYYVNVKRASLLRQNNSRHHNRELKHIDIWWLWLGFCRPLGNRWCEDPVINNSLWCYTLKSTGSNFKQNKPIVSKIAMKNQFSLLARSDCCWPRPIGPVLKYMTELTKARFSESCNQFLCNFCIQYSMLYIYWALLIEIIQHTYTLILHLQMK